MTAQEKYAKSAKGKATKKAWRALNREKIRKWKREWATSSSGKESARRWYRKSPKALFNLYQKKAPGRGLEFTLTLDEFITLVMQPCVYCGAVPTERNGIDRVDNAVGYVASNVVPCCFTCNQMKSNRSRADFLAHVVRIAQFQQSKR